MSDISAPWPNPEFLLVVYKHTASKKPPTYHLKTPNWMKPPLFIFKRCLCETIGEDFFHDADIETVSELPTDRRLCQQCERNLRSILHVFDET